MKELVAKLETLRLVFGELLKELSDVKSGLASVNESLQQIAHNQLPTVATPAIACANNRVTITCATTGATIYYTIDGSEPTKESDVYIEGGGILVPTKGITVKAFAVKLDSHDSAVASAVYEYVPPTPPSA